MLTRRNLLAGAAGGAVFAMPNTAPRAQTLPLARILCGFPAGGTADTTARRVADLWRGKLADNVLVENRVGAGGRIAINAVKDAPADGSTLLLSPDSMLTIYKSVYRKLGYDPETDVAPVSPVCRFTFALGVGPGVPSAVTSLAAFIDWAKANADKLSYGSPAAGSMPHFLGDRFFREIGGAARHAPYRGSAPALQDLVGGHVPSVLTVLGDFLPFKDSPGLRILAVADEARSRFLPEVPTFAEQGFPGVAGVETYGIFLPGKSPAALVARINTLAREAAAHRDMIDGLARLGMEAAATPVEDYRSYLDRERVRWAPIVARSGFALDE